MIKPLVLIPTPFEKRTLEPLIDPLVQQAGGTLQLCGFGPVSAAARTSQLIAQYEPEHVLLVGIAGSIGDRLPTGSAATFAEVACYGIGAGSGDSYQPASNLGWHQWDGREKSSPTAVTLTGDVLSLRSDQGFSRVEDGSGDLQLLTCCAASDSPEDVARKQRWFPKAAAEDMEGFGVAMASLLSQVPLTIVRGISNVAGDRDKSQWRTDQALEAAAEMVGRLIAGCGPAG